MRQQNQVEVRLTRCFVGGRWSQQKCFAGLHIQTGGSAAVARQIAELSPTHASMQFAASLKLHLSCKHQHILSGGTLSSHGDSDLCCMPQMQRASQDSRMYLCHGKAASAFNETQ